MSGFLIQLRLTLALVDLFGKGLGRFIPFFALFSQAFSFEVILFLNGKISHIFNHERLGFEIILVV